MGGLTVSVPLAVALLALLVALFALAALVAVYARVRALEAGRADGIIGYDAIVGRRAPATVRPGPGQRGTVLAVLDGDCALCHHVWDALVEAPHDPGLRVVALVDAPHRFTAPPGAPAEVLADASARAELFEGYAPTVLGLDADGVVVQRHFVYADTDLPGLLAATAAGREVSPA
jgi:hypothetical protein